MAIIRHYTKPHWVEHILKSGYIDLEWNNTDEAERKRIIDRYYGEGYYKPYDPHDPTLRWYAVRGRQVWFTEQQHCNTAQRNWLDCFFEFDSAEIGAEKWHYFKKRLTTPEQRVVVSEMDRSAKYAGDDPYCYWVSHTPVSIAFAKPNRGVLVNVDKWIK